MQEALAGDDDVKVPPLERPGKKDDKNKGKKNKGKKNKGKKNKDKL